jgi:hypothetical protein
MKPKQPLTLIFLAMVLLFMGVAFMSKRALSIPVANQAQTLSDWAHGSGGTLKVMLTYPTELLSNQKNTVTLTYEPDAILEQNLASGYIFDAEFIAAGSVISPQRRMLLPLEKGRQSISWEIVPFTTFENEGVIQISLGDANLNGAYAISPQVTFNLAFEVRQSNGLSPKSSFYVGLAMVGVALLLPLIFFIMKKYSFGAKG